MKQGLSRLNGKSRALRVATGLAALGLAISLPAMAQPAKEKKDAPSVAISYDRSFTPAGADPRLAAAFAERGARGFRFTPAASKDKPGQLRIAVRGGSSAPVLTGNRRAESVATVPSAVRQLEPTSYNLGASVGWKKLAVSGEVEKRESIDPRIADRESAVVGVSYNLKRFTGKLSVAADRDTTTVAPALRPTDSYALDVGGEVKITRNLSVTGGVRYRIDQDRLDNPATADTSRESQAVYVGTALKF